MRRVVGKSTGKLVRIIGGTLRGRALAGPPGEATRPMLDRMRQALFNILEHRDFGVGRSNAVRSADVLDPFCGTGALAFEALSRGARFAVMTDISSAAIRATRANARALALEAVSSIGHADACAPPPATLACNLVFLAPPYHRGLVVPSLHALQARGWLAADALVVAHTGAKEEVDPGPDFAVAHERVYGDSRFRFIVRAREARPGPGVDS